MRFVAVACKNSSLSGESLYQKKKKNEKPYPPSKVRVLVDGGIVMAHYFQIFDVANHIFGTSMWPQTAT